MPKAQRGIACAGCPHRAAYVVVKDSIGRGAGRVICGNAGCPAVGALHPAATAQPGGQERLLPRYNKPVPNGTPEAPRAKLCAHFVLDADLAAENAAAAYAGLANEADCVILCIMASSAAYLSTSAIEALGNKALELGAADACVVDPFDTAGTGQVVKRVATLPGVHALVFASPCVQLVDLSQFEVTEVDRYQCLGCQRCTQITGCPALCFAPPRARIDENACTACDLCRDYCPIGCILSARSRETPAQRRAARYAAVRTHTSTS